MKRDAEATRARIAAAAQAEFAERGIAGARVDRIAAAADANKNMIYIYVGSKGELFDAIFATAIDALLNTVPIDASDLPGYAAALFDYYQVHPQLIRLARWYALERTGMLPQAVTANAAKIDAIRTAQAAGIVTGETPAEQLLTLLLSVAGAWSSGSPESAMSEDAPELIAARRAAVVRAVQRMTAP